MKNNMFYLLAILILLLLYLIFEQIQHNRNLRRIPLRITVTGTRGKSTIVRMICAVLREDGWRVMGKVTGSEAKIIMPDGEEETVRRRGIPSILEQIRIVRRAVREGANCLVCEIMSIHPENHEIESRRLLKPHAVVIANMRADHIDAMGQETGEIAKVFALDASPGSDVYVPEKECHPVLINEISRFNSPTHLVKTGDPAFEEQKALVSALCGDLGLEEKIIKGSIQRFGEECPNPAFRIGGHVFLDAFGANDPVSTIALIREIRTRQPDLPANTAGLLALRFDRGDRTSQWISFFRNGGSREFDRLFVTGGHAHAFIRRIHADRVRSKTPDVILSEIFRNLENPALIVGMGNLHGTGKGIINYCVEAGEHVRV